MTHNFQSMIFSSIWSHGVQWLKTQYCDRWKNTKKKMLEKSTIFKKTASSWNGVFWFDKISDRFNSFPCQMRISALEWSMCGKVTFTNVRLLVHIIPILFWEIEWVRSTVCLAMHLYNYYSFVICSSSILYTNRNTWTHFIENMLSSLSPVAAAT